MDPSTPLSDLLGSEHAHIEDELAALRNTLDAGDAPRAREACAAIETEMLQHMEREERVLFPLFASRLLMVRATTVLSREHARILALVRELHDTVEEGVLVRARAVLDDLFAFVEAHHLREQSGLYSWADSLLGERIRRELCETIAKR